MELTEQEAEGEQGETKTVEKRKPSSIHALFIPCCTGGASDFIYSSRLA